MAEPARKLQELLAQATEVEANGDELAAVSRAEEKAKEVALFAKNGFKSFGAGEQAPKRPYSSQELKDEYIYESKLLTTEDTIDGIRDRIFSFIFLTGGSLILFFPGVRLQMAVVLTAIFVGVVIDLLLSQGVLQGLILDVLARIVNPDYSKRVVQHEAGRFLVAYLIGVLPKAYTLGALDCLSQFQSVAIRSGCVFCNAQLQKEIETGKVTSKTVDQFVCVKLAGVAQEYLQFGRAESGAANIRQVEDLYQTLNFEEPRKNDQTRWALLNVCRLLRRYEAVHTELAKAMERGATTGECISLIERYAEECKDAPMVSVEAPVAASMQE